MSNKPKHIPRYDLYAATFVRKPTTGTTVPFPQPQPTRNKYPILAEAFAKAGVTRECTKIE